MKAFIDSVHLLETGIEHVSPHVRWLLRNAIIEHCGKDAIDLIAYHKNIPTDNWGEAITIVKSIVINLEKHFNEVFDLVCAEQNIHVSIRALLIRELLDTAVHEAHHLKAAAETNEYENPDVEQEAARNIATNKAWLAAKKFDVEIFTFGPVLDKLLEEVIAAFKEDAEAKPELWKDLQIYMWDNKLAFYNPNKDTAIGMHAFFEAQADDIAPWLDNPAKFVGEQKVREAAVTTDQTTVPKTTPITQPVMQPVMQPTMQPQIYMGDTLEDMQSIDYSQQVVNNVMTPVMPAVQMPPVQTYTPDTTAPAGYMTTEDITLAAETVLRSLFWHVMNKCDFNIEGGFNNPQAVLEPVSIQHIPNATQLFTHMSTVDENGVKINQTPCNGFIKGKVSKQNLPMYELYLNLNGALHKRTFIAQNPNKLDSTGNALSKWAEKARTGCKIMMLLEDKVGVRAYIMLEPGQVLGQEEYKLWQK